MHPYNQLLPYRDDIKVQGKMVKHDRLSTENVPKNDSVREKKADNHCSIILVAPSWQRSGSSLLKKKKLE